MYFINCYKHHAWVTEDFGDKETRHEFSKDTCNMVYCNIVCVSVTSRVQLSFTSGNYFSGSRKSYNFQKSLEIEIFHING